MGNKLSCANCNGNPAKPSNTQTAPGSGGGGGGGGGGRGGNDPNRQYAHHYHSHSAGGGGGGGMVAAGNMSHMLSNAAAGGGKQVLRLWAEVFHVSASSGAVRWTQVSDDLVPVSVAYSNGKFHVTAVNARVEKVLDAWLTSARLGQASNCFVYWKDSVSGDTWGLNFTSAADARAFRESIHNPPTVAAPTTTTGGGGGGGHFPRRAESSYSLRDQGNVNQTTTTTTASGREPSKAGSGAHLTQKYYSNRTAISTPNSPSKRRMQQQHQHHQQMQQLHQHQQDHHQHAAHAHAQHQFNQQQAAAYAAQASEKSQCTCDCLTAEALHKQRNGRIRYSNFTRQDSGGTTQSSRSDGSLVRRQADRQQAYYRQNTRSMDEHSRTRICAAPGASLVAKALAPANRRIQAIQALSHGAHSRSMVANEGGGGYQMQQLHQNGHLGGQQQQHYHHHPQQQQLQQQQQMQQKMYRSTAVNTSEQMTMEPRSQSANEPRMSSQGAQGNQGPGVSSQSASHLVTTGTATDDLQLQQQGDHGAQPGTSTGTIKPRSQRPKSLMAIDSDGTKSRDRSHRSLEGRRRSLERMQCVDLTDASPPTPARAGGGGRDQTLSSDGNASSSLNNDTASSKMAALDKYESELRRRLLSQGGSSIMSDSGIGNALSGGSFGASSYYYGGGGGGRGGDGSGGVTVDEANREEFEYLLKESMDSVANLMKDVQNELHMIRAEERRFLSQSMQSLHRLNSANSSFRSSGSAGDHHHRASDLGHHHRSAHMWDTLSIDGQLPFLPSFSTSLSAYTNGHYQSWERGLGGAGAGYLTSSEFSDDDRASLTTAISDDEDHQLALKSSFRAAAAAAAVAAANRSTDSASNGGVNFECFGSVRKSGFLAVKKWLIRKTHSLALARKRGWKNYWVCLKGTTLLFYPIDGVGGGGGVGSGSQSSGMNHVDNSNSSSGGDAGGGGNQQQSGKSSQQSSDLTPKHLIFVEACLVQPVPEHPRRDNVFCLSTSFGDAYLFDATSLPDRDQWISVLHTACAAQIARNSGRCAITHYIVEEYQRLERLVELDMESRQEADLLLSCATEEKQKQQLVSHVLLLDEKIEKNRLEIFRLKSYMAAITREEGPNPKTLLSQVSRRTKSQLNRIGVFSVSSIHAFNCAKNPQPLEKLHKRDSFSADYIRELYSPSQAEVPEFNSNTKVTVTVTLMTGESRQVEVPSNWTSEQLISDLFGSGPEGREYYLRCSETGTVLYRNDLLKTYAAHTLVVTPKILFTIELIRDSNETLFGFSAESEMSSSSDLRVFVMRVEPNSIASLHGLCRHDEIMVINGALVQELDMMFVESVLQEELTLCLMIRSSRSEMPIIGQQPSLSRSGSAHQLGGGSFEMNDQQKTASPVTDEFIESLVCPPPPSSDFSQLILSDTQLSKFIVPKVDNFLPGDEGGGGGADNFGITGAGASLLFQNSLDADVDVGGLGMDTTAVTGLDNQYGSLLAAVSDGLAGVGTSNSTSLDLNLGPTLTSMHYQSLAAELKNAQSSGSAAAAAATVDSDLLSSGAGTSNSANHPNPPPSPAVSSINHMQKLIRELLDTENTYCQSLEQLVKLYLEPLRQNNFLTDADVKVLFGSILQIIDAQNDFRSELTEVGEHILGDCTMLLDRVKTGKSGASTTTTTTVVGGKQSSGEPSVNELGVGYIADCFLKHCANFRNYSTFCASHARAVKLMADEKTALNEWLQKRSAGQISQSLESYLIRPIQRVLKYPLLLTQMKALCAKGTVNHHKLEEAVKELEKVAEHINEMQRIHEEYGAIFEHLARNHARSMGANGPPAFGTTANGLVDLSPTALIHYGNVDWINSMEFLGKNCRKGVELNSICFVFRQFVVFLCKETIRHRKRMPSARSTDVEIIRHQVLIPVIEVQVRASPQNDNEADYKWDLIQLKMNAGKRSEKIYRLSNRSSESRNQFLRTIRQIIREDVRQMNVLVGSGGGGGGGGSSGAGGKGSASQSSAGGSSGKQSRGPGASGSAGAGGRSGQKGPPPSGGAGRQMLSKQQQLHQHQHQQHHHHHGESSSSGGGKAVPCSTCGKDVPMGLRQKELMSSAGNWKQRQDSSSTNSR